MDKQSIVSKAREIINSERGHGGTSEKELISFYKEANRSIGKDLNFNGIGIIGVSLSIACVDLSLRDEDEKHDLANISYWILSRSIKDKSCKLSEALLRNSRIGVIDYQSTGISFSVVEARFQDKDMLRLSERNQRDPPLKKMIFYDLHEINKINNFDGYENLAPIHNKLKTKYKESNWGDQLDNAISKGKEAHEYTLRYLDNIKKDDGGFEV